MGSRLGTDGNGGRHAGRPVLSPNNQAYVGGPAEYQAYQQQRAANKLAEENLETAQLYQDEAMNWGAWGGWGAGWGPMGMGVGMRGGRF